VDAVLRGDREAFRFLVERESDMLVRACQRVLGDPHEAEDVAQEAFLVAFRSLGTWRGDGPFGAWLARIGVRLALRRAAQRSRRDVAWIDPVEPELVGAASGPAAGLAQLALDRRSALDPAAVALRADEAAAVRSAVARLDEPYREVVALRFFGELSLGEIAAEADRPLATVKTQLRRGLLRLRQVLGEDRR
jgi:RNA polymerase sigma-70 factor (ECF subfamily)